VTLAVVGWDGSVPKCQKVKAPDAAPCFTPFLLPFALPPPLLPMCHDIIYRNHRAACPAAKRSCLVVYFAKVSLGLSNFGI